MANLVYFAYQINCDDHWVFNYLYWWKQKCVCYSVNHICSWIILDSHLNISFDFFLSVLYAGHGKTPKDAASVRATHPIPAACGIYYFEVKIVSKGRDG